MNPTLKSTMNLAAVAVALALSSNAALAQEGEDEIELDVTISVMPEDAELPGVVTAELMLPMDGEGVPIPADAGIQNSARGLDTANAARVDGRAFGEAAAEAAQTHREELGRGSVPDLGDLPPADLPIDLSGVPGGAPGRPEVPAAPELPEVPTPNVP